MKPCECVCEQCDHQPHGCQEQAVGQMWKETVTGSVIRRDFCYDCAFMTFQEGDWNKGPEFA